MKNSWDTFVPSFEHIAKRKCPTNYVVPYAARDFHNFMFILSGEGFYVRNEVAKSVHGPLLIYHPPGVAFGYYASKNKDNAMQIVAINAHLASVKFEKGNWKIDNVDTLSLASITRLDDPNRLRERLELLVHNWTASKEDTILQCRNSFMSILTELPYYMKGEEKHSEAMIIQPAIRYIHQYYREKITLSTLSNEVGLTPSYFGMLFKRITGDSPITYIHRCRVETAVPLLQAGIKIGEVANMVGFEDPFYFSKVFKKVIGMSPKEYSNYR